MGRDVMMIIIGGPVFWLLLWVRLCWGYEKVRWVAHNTKSQAVVVVVLLSNL